MLLNIRSTFLIFAISLFLCQSGICAGLQNIFTVSTPSVSSCHDSGHMTKHKTPEGNILVQLQAVFDSNSCCFKTTLNASNFNFKTFSHYERQFSIAAEKKFTQTNLYNTYYTNDRPPPEIYNINSVFLI